MPKNVGLPAGYPARQTLTQAVSYRGFQRRRHFSGMRNRAPSPWRILLWSADGLSATNFLSLRWNSFSWIISCLRSEFLLTRGRSVVSVNDGTLIGLSCETDCAAVEHSVFTSGQSLLKKTEKPAEKKLAKADCSRRVTRSSTNEDQFYSLPGWDKMLIATTITTVIESFITTRWNSSSFKPDGTWCNGEFHHYQMKLLPVSNQMELTSATWRMTHLHFH